MILAWHFYLIEFINYGTFSLLRTEWFFELKVLAFYHIIGLIAGIIASGIIAPKQKKYQTIADYRHRSYPLFLLKSISIGFLFIILFIIRAAVAKPSIFTNSIYTKNSLFHGVLDFVVNGFSPLYFSILILSILIFFIYRVTESIVSSDNLIRTVKFLLAAVFAFYFFFSYEALYAEKKQDKKNLFFFGFGSDALTAFNQRNKNLSTQLSDSLCNNSYKFENFFTTAAEPYAAAASIFSGLLPVGTGILAKEISDKSKEKFHPQFLIKLVDSGYQVVIVLPQNLNGLKDEITDRRIKIISAPNLKNATALSVERHPMLMGFINHSFLIKQLFPEYFLLPDCQFNDYLADLIADEVDRIKPLALFYFGFPEYNQLPYPYYRLPEQDALNLFIEHSMSGILELFELQSKNSLILINGLPQQEISLRANDLKMPLYCYDSNNARKKGVRSFFSTKDLSAVVFDLLDIDFDNYTGSTRNLTNAANQTEDILVIESWKKFAARKGLTKIIDPSKQQNNPTLYQYYNAFSQKILLSGHRQYDHLPLDSGIVTNISIPEKEIISDKNIRNSLLKMDLIMENILTKYSYQKINGYYVK